MLTPVETPEKSADANIRVTGRSLNRSQLMSICALGLAICFFLPWLNLFFGKPSGFDIAKQEGGKALLLWSVPIFSALTIFANLTGRNQKIVAQLTGALPFIILAYALSQGGRDVLRLLEVGAYVSLVIGLALFVLPRKLK